MNHEAVAEELADFAHQRAPFDTKWMDDRIKLFLERNVVIPKADLPAVSLSPSGNGFVTALAQERFQPRLRLEDGEQNTGEWSRKIAYANLAIAEAVEGERAKEAGLLASEAHHLYLASCEHQGINPMACEWIEVKDKYEALARAARKLHGKDAS